MLEGCHIKSRSFHGLSLSHLSRVQGTENVWVCFGTIPPLPHAEVKSKTKTKKGEKVISHHSQRCQKCGRCCPRQETTSKCKSVRSGIEGSLPPCVLSNTNQTPVPIRAKQQIDENTKALHSARSYILHEVWGAHT